ncbi:MAG: helix-turn-helix domain-containing protein [Acidobacteriota bacterium]
MKEPKVEYVDQLSEIVESILVPGKLVNKVLSVVVSMSASERGAVFLNTAGNKLEAKAAVGLSPNALNPIKDVCNSYLLDSSKATNLVYVADTRRDEKFRKISVLKNSEILSFACVPLKVDGNIYGVLYLDSTIQAKLFSSLDLERVSRFSKLITSALLREQKLGDTDLRIPTVSVNDYLAERSIDEIERQQLHAILERHAWNVTRTSQAMDVPRRTLYNKMTKYGIRRPRRGKVAVSAMA